METETGAVITGIVVVTEDFQVIGASVVVGVPKRDQTLRLGRTKLDVDDAVIGDGEVARTAKAVVHDNRLETVRQRESAIVRTAWRQGWRAACRRQRHEQRKPEPRHADTATFELQRSTFRRANANNSFVTGSSG